MEFLKVCGCFLAYMHHVQQNSSCSIIISMLSIQKDKEYDYQSTCIVDLEEKGIIENLLFLALKFGFLFGISCYSFIALRC